MSVARITTLLERQVFFLPLMGFGLAGYVLYARLVFLYGRIAGGTDEGMYLHAARTALAGGLTYRDFAFIQGPLYPYLLGLFLAPFQFEERPARILAIAVTLLSLVLTAWAAGRLGGRLAALSAFALLVTNLDYVTDLSSGVHPSGRTGGLLIALATLLLAYERPLWCLLPLVLLAATRVLFVPLMVTGLLAAALTLCEARRPLIVASGLAGAAFAPFLVADPRAAWFGLIGEQSGRTALLPRLTFLPPQTLATQLRSLQTSAVTELASYWPAMLALVVVIVVLVQPHLRAALGRQCTIVLLFCVTGSVAMFLVDLLPYPFTARYPVPELPLIAIAGAVALGVLLRQPTHSAAPILAAMVTLTLVLMNPFAATREAVGTPNFVEAYRTNPPLVRLEEIARFVRDITPEGGALITLETQIAVEAHRRLWPGLGISSWGILSLSDSEAQRFEMTSPNLLAEAIESRAAAAVIVSDRYTWELARLPNKARIQRSLARDYMLVREFLDVSDWGTVHIYVPRV